MSEETDVPEVRLTVTVPPSPSEIGETLRNDQPELVETADVFRHVALQAQKRLVFVVPFFDAHGAARLCELYRASRAPQRILICRGWEDVRAAGSNVETELNEAGVEVRPYRIHHVMPGGRISVETFHAKIALADAMCAYVGSANAMRSSFETTMECGVLLRGAAVAQVKGLVDVLLRHC